MLAGLGVVAGIVNILAGGGGLIALPALVLLGGLGDTTANGTFRIAVLAQTLTAVVRFERGGHVEWRIGGRLLVPTLIGAALGAWQAATLGDGGTRRLLVGSTLLATMLLLVGERWLAAPPTAEFTDWTDSSKPSRRVLPLIGLPPALALGLLVAGWYGGLIQAGVGFVLLLVLRRAGGFALGRATVMKVLLVLGYTPIALLVFANGAKIDPYAGLSLAAGMAVGAWIGAGLSVGPAASGRIRVAVAMMVAVAAVRLVLA